MTEGVAIIDVWDVGTFDSELRADLDAHADVIRDYMLISRHQRLEHEASEYNMLCTESPYAGETISVKERTMRLMKSARSVLCTIPA